MSGTSEGTRTQSLLRLKQENLLKISKDGSSNIDEWTYNLAALLKASFGVYASIIMDGKIKPEWEYLPAAPNQAAVLGMSEIELATAKAKNALALETYKGWQQAKIAMIPHITCNVSQASIDKIEMRDKEKFRKAVIEDDVIEVISLIKVNHRVRDRDAAREEKRRTHAELLTFKMNDGETLSNYKTRWDTLVKRSLVFEITISSANFLFYFTSGLKNYPSVGVRDVARRTLVKLERVPANEEDDPKWDVEDVFDSMCSNMAAEAPMSIKEVAMALPTVASTKEKIKKHGSEPPAKKRGESSDKAAKKRGTVTTEDLVKRFTEEEGISRAEALQKIKCFNCQGNGHVKSECPEKPKSKDKDQKKRSDPGRKRSKKSGDAFAGEGAVTSDGESAANFDEFVINGAECFACVDDGWTTVTYGKKIKAKVTSKLQQDVVRNTANYIRVEVSADVLTASSEEREEDEAKDYFYDDSLSNVPMVHNVKLLSKVVRLKTPFKVAGVGGATITHAGWHPFLGRVLVLPTLKYNIIPQAFWLRKYGYQVHIDPHGKWLSFSRDGCVSVVFHEHRAHGRSFKRVHNAMLRWSPSGDVTPPPHFARERNEERGSGSELRGGSGSGFGDSIPDYIAYSIADNANASRYYTPEQQQRASEAAQLHDLLGHPSDDVLRTYVKSPSLTNCHLSAQDITNMRAIVGPCTACDAGKPKPVRGRNSLHEPLGITEPGQLLHCDLVYWGKRIFLLCVDELSGYVFLPQLESKSAEHVMAGFQRVFTALQAGHRVVQHVHTDAERVFDSLRDTLGAKGITLKSHLPNEHEVVAERAFRAIREKVRVVLASIRLHGIAHPSVLEPYLIQHCVQLRNRTPNSRSGIMIPFDILYGERVNYHTDFKVGYMSLVLVATPSATHRDPSAAKHEICLCLGLVGRGMPGAVWTLSMNSTRPLQRRPLRVCPMTEDWRRALVEMSEKWEESRIDDFLLEVGSNTDKAPIVESAEDIANNAADGVPDRTTATTVGNGLAGVGRHADIVSSTELANNTSESSPTSVPVKESNDTTVSIQNTEVSELTTTTKETEPSTTVAQDRATMDSSEPPPAPPEPVLRRSSRTRIPNRRYDANLAAYLALGDRSRDDELGRINVEKIWASANNSKDTFEPDGNEIRADHTPPEADMLCMVTSLESALRTPHRDAAVAATKKELKSLVEHKTWRYLSRIEDRQPSIHTGVEPSACILKDKKDSFGQFLLYKSRFYNVGSHTNDANYGAFDKTSPTASHDTVCLLLSLAAQYKWNVETFDVPSAYLKASLEDGKRHCMKINRTVTEMLVEVDPTARRYVQQDGTLLVELLQALYGLPEAGKLWHAFLCDVLRGAGYQNMPTDTCLWKRIVKVGGEQHVSIIAIVVDDCLHLYNKVAAREHLHSAIRKKNIPSVTVQQLSVNSPVSFCGISIEYHRGRNLFISQPGYLTALVNEYAETTHTHPSPLPSNYSTRVLTDNQTQPLPGGTGRYLRVLNSIAWMERTRPDIACAVSYLQTQQAEPRVIDWKDVQHLLGYLRGTGNLGVLFYDSDGALCLLIDVGLGVHLRDRKSHTGWVLRFGRDGCMLAWGSSKQKSVASSSTEGELIGVSDCVDILLLMKARLEFLRVKPELPMIVMQDNTSTITIAYMGRPSAASRRRYIDIRYFWFKQYLDNGTIRMEYCPSALQYADILASVRNGQPFNMFVNKLMAVAPARREKPDQPGTKA